MEKKTKIHAEDNRQELLITREFDLPVDLLFKAYTEPELVEEWMGTKVLKLENKEHGSYRFETTDPKGNKHLFSGVVHGFNPEKSIIRTFEMENTGFEPQLEFLDFKNTGDETSKLTMHLIFRTIEQRDNLLRLPFAQGINFAHDRLEKSVSKLKNKT